MDLCEGFSDDDGELDRGLDGLAREQDHHHDLLSAFSDDDSSLPRQILSEADTATDAIALLEPHAVAVAAPEALQPVMQMPAANKQAHVRAGYSLQGKVGRGRHGTPVERQIACAHMRAEKRQEQLVASLNGCTFLKDNQSFKVTAKMGRTGGVQVVVAKEGGKGNQHVRRIPFAAFVRAAFSLNCSNIALAAILNVDSSTVPRLQKSCAAVMAESQNRLLSRLLAYCQQNPPVTVHTQVKWDETTISTSLNPGGVSHSVKSSWSTLVVRSRLRIAWASGATWTMRLIYPPVPLISCSAEQMCYALRHHPSFYIINELVKAIGQTAQIRCKLHEVDGAYANLRLHHHLLSLSENDSQKPGGSYLDSVRCQSHATHLISVSMLALIGGSVLSRLYGLCVFLRNLGYLLRLQLALKQWLEDIFLPKTERNG